MSAARIVTALALLCMAARASADDLDQLMRLMAAHKHGRSSFIEQQFLAILKRPLESRGELLYDAPGRLEKRTIEPRAETVIVDGDEMSMQRGSRRRALNLRDFPAIAPFITSIRATLSGDRASLEGLFAVQFAGELAAWNLDLTPLDPVLAKSVARIRIDGVQADLLHVEIRQTDGDRSLLTLRRSTAP